MKGQVLNSFVRTWGTISEVKLAINLDGMMLRGKGPRKPEFAQDVIPTQPLMIYTDLIEYNIVGNKKAPSLRCFSLAQS